MKYIVFNSDDGRVHEASDDGALTELYQSLISPDELGSVEAFNEFCTVIRGGDVVKVGLTIKIDDGKKKPVYRGGDGGAGGPISQI